VEVGCEEHWFTRSRAHGVDVKAITCKGRDENLSINHQLCWAAPILGDLLADFATLAGMVPVEVERDEDLCDIFISCGLQDQQGR
jgi:hypothetical protein